MDRDYLDDRRFPPEEGCGVLVIQRAERARAVQRWSIGLTVSCFSADESPHAVPMPLVGRKLHVHTDWQRTMVDTADFQIADFRFPV